MHVRESICFGVVCGVNTSESVNILASHIMCRAQHGVCWCRLANNVCSVWMSSKLIIAIYLNPHPSQPPLNSHSSSSTLIPLPQPSSLAAFLQFPIPLPPKGPHLPLCTSPQGSYTKPAFDLLHIFGRPSCRRNVHIQCLSVSTWAWIRIAIQ